MHRAKFYFRGSPRSHPRRPLPPERSGSQHGVAFLESDGANQRVFNLVNKGEVFEEIVQHPDVMVVMDKLLGGDFILSGFSSNTTGPGARR